MVNPFLQHGGGQHAPPSLMDCLALSALPLESYSPGASAATVKAHRRGGLLLASNPRLLCLCCREDPSGGNGGAPGVAILDLWQQGRTVFFPTSTKPLAAAISPFRGETYVCVQTGAALQVHSLPRQCVIAELALDDAALRDGGALLRWRWLGPGVLVLIAEQGVYYWPALAKGAAAAAAPQRGFARTTESLGLARVAGYDCSADGKWAVLSALHADGSGAVALDVRCFPARATFAMPALGAALLVMPGSSPPVNLLALVVQNEMGQPELRVMDLDGSIGDMATTGDVEGLARLRRGEKGAWVLLANHCICEPSADGAQQASSGQQDPVLASPSFMLRQWPRNPHVLCVVARDGVLRLFDVHTCARLHCCRVASGPVLEAEVDAEQGDLLLLVGPSANGVSVTAGCEVVRVAIVAPKLHDWVELTLGEPELASRAALLSPRSGGAP
eukprot:TRINITY_DN2243_c1_g2_i4.p1 TRINITY_DN2243_c1_g2~~TRINITY_DN2243_c1_g2_i4.p1  ORF type:complete len:489 (-),score=199.12 TRINITY_DN2243_c1_g2_i4:1606-2943(-)